jgi:DNA-binding CsgD family transcriptional regulator
MTTNSQKSLNNLRESNRKKASRILCGRGHYNWKVYSDGKRRCMTCKELSRKGPRVKRDPIFGLRDIEITVVRDMSNGLSVAQTAEQNNYSIQGIKSLRAKVRKKLRAYDNAQAVAILLRYKIIE